MRALFRATREEGWMNSLMKIIEFPLAVARDYTTPIGELEAWDRTRASIVPMLIVFAFLWLNGNMQPSGNLTSMF